MLYGVPKIIEIMILLLGTEVIRDKLRKMFVTKQSKSKKSSIISQQLNNYTIKNL